MANFTDCIILKKVSRETTLGGKLTKTFCTCELVVISNTILLSDAKQ